MIVERLIDSDHCHFGRWIGEVGICCANRKPCDVQNTAVVNSAVVRRITNVEVTVGRVVRIKCHPENSAALALSEFEGISRNGIALTVRDGRLMILISPCCSATKSQPVSLGGAPT